MLISIRVEQALLFAEVRAVVVDEVHAFGSDDRGWHLLAVLERLSRLAGRPIQRVGLSATIGNPGELLIWLQGSGARLAPSRRGCDRAGAIVESRASRRGLERTDGRAVDRPSSRRR